MMMTKVSAVRFHVRIFIPGHPVSNQFNPSRIESLEPHGFKGDCLELFPVLVDKSFWPLPKYL